MIVVINTRFLTQKTTGVQRYAIEICRCLPKYMIGKKIIFVAPKGHLVKKNEMKGFDIEQFGNFKGHLWEQIDLVNFLRKKNNPLLINLGGIGPIFYKNKIIYIHDLAFKYFPKAFSFIYQKIYNIFLPISAKNSIKVLTVSNYVRKDIQDNFNIPNVEVVYAAQTNVFKNFNLKRDKIILAVSSMDPRKNFHRLINAFIQIDSDYKLVIVGAKSKLFSEVNLNEDYDNKNIIFTGYLEDYELIKLYNRASVFIYASLFEGFGMPPLEAQACGCPCIVSNTTSLPEIYEDSVEYCDPFSIESIKSKLLFLMGNEKIREDLKTKGFQNIKRFSWDKSANKLSSIIHKELV